MLFAVISYPELSLADYYLIQEIRTRCDKENYKIIRPHFTFVFPLSGINQNDLCRHVEKCINTCRSFDFTINRAEPNAGLSGDQWHLFTVPEKGYDKMVNLHDSLYTGILSEKLQTDIPYLPHITVGVFDNKHESDRVRDELNKQKLTLSGRITTIEIISIESNQIETIRNFKLLS